MAEAFNSLFKAECIRNPVMRPKGGWASIRDVEIAVVEYVDWFNHRRLHGEIGLVPPAEAEATYWASQPAVEYARKHVRRGRNQLTEPPRNPGRFSPYQPLLPGHRHLPRRYLRWRPHAAGRLRDLAARPDPARCEERSWGTPPEVRPLPQGLAVLLVRRQAHDRTTPRQGRGSV